MQSWHTSAPSRNKAARRATLSNLDLLPAAGRSKSLSQGVAVAVVDEHCHRVTVYTPSRDDVTSSTKPEVHNVLRCHQRRTEPRSQVTCTENLVNFGRVFAKYCHQRVCLSVCLFVCLLAYLKSHSKNRLKISRI